jgi:hypothetical protein
MKRTIDDLPLIKVSALVAAGTIKPDAKTALIRFGDDEVEHRVGVKVWRFGNGGFWARLGCPRCGGWAQRLRLLDDMPACGECVRSSGLIYRSQSIRTEKRHEVTAPKRIERLNGGGPRRVHQPGRRVALRARVEAALRRSIIVARQYGHDEFEQRVKRLSRE